MKTFTLIAVAFAFTASLAHAGEGKKLGEGQCFDLKQNVIASLPKATAASRSALEADIANLAGQCAQPQLAMLLKKELGRRLGVSVAQR